MPALNHTHTYKRYTKKLYMCAHPDCIHTIDKRLIKGKSSLCNLCGAPMILTADDLKRAEPRCYLCSNTKEANLSRRARNLMESIVQSSDELLKEIPGSHD